MSAPAARLTGTRAARVLVVLTLLATAALAPPLTSAAGEAIEVSSATTIIESTELAVSVTGDPETTYAVRFAAADSCAGTSAPEAQLPDDGTTATTETDGTAFVVTYVQPPLTPGWFVVASLLSQDQTTTFATSACVEVTGSLIPPPSLQGQYVLEPDRDAILLDYGLDQPPASCDLALDPTSVPDPSDFVVALDGSPVTVIGVAIPTDDPCPLSVGLALDGPLATGAVGVSYTPGANPIKNQAGELANGFGAGFGARERVLFTTLEAGASITTDGEGDGAAGQDLIETTVTAAPDGGERDGRHRRGHEHRPCRKSARLPSPVARRSHPHRWRDRGGAGHRRVRPPGKLAARRHRRGLPDRRGRGAGAWRGRCCAATPAAGPRPSPSRAKPDAASSPMASTSRSGPTAATAPGPSATTCRRRCSPSRRRTWRRSTT